MSKKILDTAFNSSIQETEAGRSEFEANLVYRASSRTARNTQRNPVSKNKEPNLKQTNKKKTHQDIGYIKLNLKKDCNHFDIMTHHQHRARNCGDRNR